MHAKGAFFVIYAYTIICLMMELTAASEGILKMQG
jgi:hypothetical protein